MKKIFITFVVLCCSSAIANSLPQDFVYLKDIDATIQQDIRYAGYHNFIGHPITGYDGAECILTRESANALKQVQTVLRKNSLSLKVYDCYRPQMAVNDFIHWSSELQQQQMKAEFYPRVNKANFFQLGYVAMKSGHTRGSTMDLTIVPLASVIPVYKHDETLIACYKPYHKRFPDNSIDMGTGFDCMDPFAHIDNQNIDAIAYHNRLLLEQVMEKYGFVPYPQEWWHFTLRNEPFPNTYFNFPIEPEKEKRVMSASNLN